MTPAPKLKSSRRHEVTLPGLVYIGITLFVMIAAVNSQTNLLFFMFGTLVGGLVVSAVVSLLMLRKIEVRRLVSDHSVAGEPLDLHYLITNRKKRLPCFALGVTETKIKTPAGEPLTETPEGFAIHSAPGQSITVMTRLVAPRRGILRLYEIRLTCSFPFGFLKHAKHLRIPLEIVVYPRIGALNRQLALRYREAITAGSMTSSVRGGNDDFYGLREYRNGDNIRAIHWKRTARTGQLMIREMTANAPPQMVVVLDLRHHAELPPETASESIERAIQLAASLVCYGFTENFAVGLTIAGNLNEELPIPQMGREVRQRLLYRLATIDASTLRPDLTPPHATKLARRAEWLVVTLRSSDDTTDLIPAGSTRTTLAMDDPESVNWLHFLKPEETHRLLRDAAAH